MKDYLIGSDNRGFYFIEDIGINDSSFDYKDELETADESVDNLPIDEFIALMTEEL